MEAMDGAAHAPHPESIAALIELIVASKWPAGNVEQAEYFARLGFDQVAGHSPANHAAAVASGACSVVRLWPSQPPVGRLTKVICSPSMSFLTDGLRPMALAS